MFRLLKTGASGLLLFVLASGCAVASSGDESTEEPVDTTSSALTAPAAKRANTPCIYSDYNGGGTELCFDGLGSYQYGSAFVAKSFRPGNAVITLHNTDLAAWPPRPGAAIDLSYRLGEIDYTPEQPSTLGADGPYNLKPNSASWIVVRWQGADFQFQPGSIVLASTNVPGPNPPFCLDAPAGSNGLDARILPCNNSAFQYWPFGTLNYPGVLKSGVGDFCLDFALPPGGQGSKIQMWQCNGWSNQQWHFIARSSAPNTYLIQEQAQGFFLDVKNGVIAAGTPVWGWVQNNGYAQIWMRYGNH
jgi:Ricin-type beta-trefoil lectin domain